MAARSTMDNYRKGERRVLGLRGCRTGADDLRLLSGLKITERTGMDPVADLRDKATLEVFDECNQAMRELRFDYTPETMQRRLGIDIEHAQRELGMRLRLKRGAG